MSDHMSLIVIVIVIGRLWKRDLIMTDIVKDRMNVLMKGEIMIGIEIGIGIEIEKQTGKEIEIGIGIGIKIEIDPGNEGKCDRIILNHQYLYLSIMA